MSEIIKIGFDYRAGLDSLIKNSNNTFDTIEKKGQQIKISFRADDTDILKKIQELQKYKLNNFTLDFKSKGINEQIQMFNELETRITEIINLMQVQSGTSNANTQAQNNNTNATQNNTNAQNANAQASNNSANAMNNATNAQNANTQSANANANAQNNQAEATKKSANEAKKLANQMGRIQTNINVGQYTSQVEALISQYRKLGVTIPEIDRNVKLLENDLKNLNSSNNSNLISNEEKYQAQLKKTRNELTIYRNTLANPIKVTNTANTLQQWIKANSNAYSKFGNEINKLTNQLTKNINAVTNETLLQVNQRFSQIRQEALNLGLTGKSVTDSLKIGFKSLLTYLGTVTSFYAIINYIRRSINLIVELDDSLVDLSKTAKMNTTQLNEFYLSSNKTAKQMGVTTNEIIQQASAWSRLGFSTAEAATEMAKLSSQFASISPGMSTDQAQSGIVSIVKAYGIAVDDVKSEILDNINILGNKFAESNTDIINGLSKSAAAMSAMGQSLNDTLALFTGGQEILQDADSMGTALRSMSMRIRGYDEETEQLSEDLEGVTGKVADLTMTVSTPGGISIFTDETQETYKSMVTYLGELSDVWDQISEKNQNELLQQLFGKTRANAGAAIITNFESVRKALETMEDSAGSADAEMSKIEQSLTYKLNALKQTWTEFIMDSASREFLGNVFDLLTNISEVIVTINKNLGALPTLGAFIGGIVGLKDKSILNGALFSKLNIQGNLTSFFTSFNEGITKGLNATVNSTSQSLQTIRTKLDAFRAELTAGYRVEQSEIIRLSAAYDEEVYNAYNAAEARITSNQEVIQSTEGVIAVTEQEVNAYKQSLVAAANAQKASVNSLYSNKQINKREKNTQIRAIDQDLAIKTANAEELLIKERIAETQGQINQEILQQEAAERNISNLNRQQSIESLASSNQNATKSYQDVANASQNASNSITAGNNQISNSMQQRSASTQAAANSTSNLTFQEILEQKIMASSISDSTIYLNTLAERVISTKYLSEAQRQNALENIALVTGTTTLTKATMEATLAALEEAEARGIVLNASQLQTKQDLLLVQAEMKLAESQSTLAAKTASAVSGIVSMGLNMIKFAAIAKVISIAYEALDNFIHAEEKASEAAKEANTNIQNARDTLKDHSELLNENKDRFIELSEGVDKFGNNLSLSSDDYKEYLEISDKFADAFPSLITGYTDTGDAIVYIGSSADESKKKLDELLESEKELANQEIVKNLGAIATDTYNKVKDAKEELNKLKNERNDIDKSNIIIDDYVDGGIGIDFSNKSNLDSKQIESIKSKLSEYGVQYEDNVDGFYNSILVVSEKYKPLVQDAINSVLLPEDDNEQKALLLENEKAIKEQEAIIENQYQTMTNDISVWAKTTAQYDYLSDYKKQLVDALIPKIDWNEVSNTEGLELSSAEQYEEYIMNNIITPLMSGDLPGKFDKLLEQLFTIDENNIDIVGIGNQIQKIFDRYGIKLNITPFISEQQDSLDRLKNQLKEQFSINYHGSSYVNPKVEKFTENFGKDEIDNWLKITDGITDADEAIKKYIQSTVKLSDYTEKNRTEIIDGLTGISSGFDIMDKIYADVKDGDVFDFTNLDTKKFEENFSNVKKEYNDFISSIAENNNDISKSQPAFDKLITAWLKSEGVLDGLNEEQKQVAVNMLEMYGVSNAEEYVTQELNEQLEKERISTKLLSDEKYNLSSAYDFMEQSVVDNIQKLLEEENASYSCKLELMDLVAKQTIFNQQSLDVSDKIKQLKNLAEAYTGVAKASQLSVLFSGYTDRYNNKIGEFSGLSDSAATELYNTMVDNAYNSFINNQKKIAEDAKIGVKYAGGDTSNKSKSTSTSTKSNNENDYIDWIERKVNVIKNDISTIEELYSSLSGLQNNGSSILISNLDKQIEKNELLADTYRKSKDVYKQFAEEYVNQQSSILNSDLVSKIQNGSLSDDAIKKYDDDTKRIIEEYKSRWDQYKSASENEISTLNKIKSLRTDILNITLDDNEAIRDKNDAYANLLTTATAKNRVSDSNIQTYESDISSYKNDLLSYKGTLLKSLKITGKSLDENTISKIKSCINNNNVIPDDILSKIDPVSNYSLLISLSEYNSKVQTYELQTLANESNILKENSNKSSNLLDENSSKRDLNAKKEKNANSNGELFNLYDSDISTYKNDTKIYKDDYEKSKNDFSESQKSAKSYIKNSGLSKEDSSRIKSLIRSKKLIPDELLNKVSGDAYISFIQYNIALEQKEAAKLAYQSAKEEEKSNIRETKISKYETSMNQHSQMKSYYSTNKENSSSAKEQIYWLKLQQKEELSELQNSLKIAKTKVNNDEEVLSIQQEINNLNKKYRKEELQYLIDEISLQKDLSEEQLNNSTTLSQKLYYTKQVSRSTISGLKLEIKATDNIIEKEKLRLQIKEEQKKQKKDSLSLLQEEAEKSVSLYQTEKENANSSMKKVSYIALESVYQKVSYDNQIKIAKLNGDTLEVEKLRAERTKSIRDYNLEIIETIKSQYDLQKSIYDLQKERAYGKKDKANLISNSSVSQYESDYSSYLSAIENYGKNSKEAEKALLQLRSNQASSISDLYNWYSEYASKEKEIVDSEKQLATSAKEKDKYVIKSLKYNLESLYVQKQLAEYEGDTLTARKIQSQIENEILSARKEILSNNKSEYELLKEIYSIEYENTYNTNKKHELQRQMINEEGKAFSQELASLQLSNNKLEIEKAIANYQSSLIKSYVQMNKDYQEEYDTLSDISKLNESNATSYSEKNAYEEQYINLVKLSYMEQINNALLIGDENTALKLQIELRDKIQSSSKQQFDNIKEGYEKEFSYLSQIDSMYDKIIKKSELIYGTSTQSGYTAQISLQEIELSKLQKRYSSLTESMSKIDMYSDEWYSVRDSMFSLESEISETENKILELNNSLQSLNWSKFDDLQNQFSNIISESDFLISLLSNEEMFNKDASITDFGRATQGLYAQNYNTYMEQAKQYYEEAQSIKKLYESDPANTTLRDRYNDLISSQMDLIKSAESAKQSILSLVKDGFSSWTDALKDLIDKTKEALDAEKDLYDYQNNISDKSKTVNEYQKQLISLSGDTSEENRATLQKLQKNLEDAQKDLRETEYEKYISDQKELMDDVLEDANEWVEEILKNDDELISKVIDDVNLNSSNISDTLQSSASGVGYDISESLKSIWDSYDNSVSTYTSGISDNITNVISSLDSIKLVYEQSEQLRNEYVTNSLDKVSSEVNSLNSIGSDINNSVLGVQSVVSQAVQEVSNDLSDISIQLANVQSGANSAENSVISSTNNSVSSAENYTNSATNSVNGMVSKQGNSVKNVNSDYLSSYEKAISDAQNNVETLKELYNNSKDNLSKFKDEYLFYKDIYEKNKNGNPNLAEFSKQNYNEAKENYQKAKDEHNSIVLQYRDAKNALSTAKNNLENAKKTVSYASFNSGGFVDLIKQSGEDGIAFVKRGEAILPSNMSIDWKQFVNSLPALNSTISSFNNLSNIPISNNSDSFSGNVNTNLTINLPSVKNYDDFKQAIKTDKQFENIIQSMTLGRAMKGNSLNKLKY